MSNRDTNFYFLSYDISGTLTTLTDYDASTSRQEREREVLEEYIKTEDAIIEGESGVWYFGEIQPDQSYSLGQFGKVYTEEPTTFDPDEGKFIDDAAPNTEADYSMFVLDFSNNLIIFNTKNRIGHQQFRKYFSKGFNNHANGDISIEADFIRNRDEIEQVVSEKPVYEVSLELEPSNPSSEPEWEDLDESIQDMLAKKLEVLAESREDKPLNMDEDLLEQAVEMAQTRYGIDYRIVYDDGGQVKSITKDRNPVQKEEEKPDTLGGLRGMTTSLIAFAMSYSGNDDQ